VDKRREYFDDPSAPRPNSLVPAASGVVVDDHGGILLHRRADSGLWSLPGGAMDVGESIAQTIVREVKEETGLEIDVVRLIGIYSDPRHVIAYSDGEVRQQFSVCFACRVVGGRLRKSDESHELRFFSADQMDSIDIQPSIRLRLQHFRDDLSEPVIV
jgi:8-oxo-dGTP pyrophosphatase MutT (NUDIX family)